MADPASDSPPGPASENEPDRLSALREEYTREGLEESDLDTDPTRQLQAWLDEAIDAGLYDPTAMVLSTVAASSRPSSRAVLLKGLSPRGLVFYTHYSSRKGTELGEDPWCSLVFGWHPLQRQVRVEGRATRLASEENDDYFARRPRGSQLAAWASPQSEVVASRAELDRRYAEAEARFEGGPVPRPRDWGGYRVQAEVFEFWQGRGRRMHDRFRYRRSSAAATDADTGWQVDRLAP